MTTTTDPTTNETMAARADSEPEHFAGDGVLYALRPGDRVQAFDPAGGFTTEAVLVSCNRREARVRLEEGEQRGEEMVLGWQEIEAPDGLRVVAVEPEARRGIGTPARPGRGDPTEEEAALHAVAAGAAAFLGDAAEDLRAVGGAALAADLERAVEAVAVAEVAVRRLVSGVELDRRRRGLAEPPAADDDADRL